MSEWSPKPVELLAGSVEKLIGQIAQSLPANVATLDVKDDSAVSESGSVVLSPKRPSAARIHIDVDEEARVVFLSLGRGAAVGDLWRRVFTNPLRSRRKCLYEYEPYD